MDVPGFTTLIYHSGFDTIELTINIPCSEESDNCGDSNQRVTRYVLRGRLCRIMN
jgi:hypothetical protein